MSTQFAIETLVETLTVVSEYDNPLDPVYDALQKQHPALSNDQGNPSKRTLTLFAIRQQTALLHDYAHLAHDQTLTINRVITSCKQLVPIPMIDIPHGF